MWCLSFSENRVGFRIKQIMKDEEIYRDRESQIKAIDKTFAKAQEPVCMYRDRESQIKAIDKTFAKAQEPVWGFNINTCYIKV